MYADLKYPWQQLILDAYLEFDSVRLPLKVNQAERAVSKRLREPQEPAPPVEEQTALYDALRALRVLSPQKAEEQDSGEKRNIA
jgi:hypothetical protein